MPPRATITLETLYKSTFYLLTYLFIFCENVGALALQGVIQMNRPVK